MSLDPHAIATQGIGYGLLFVALQGFVVVGDAPPGQEAPGGRPHRFVLPDDLTEMLRRRVLTTDDLLIVIAGQMVMSRKLH